MVQDMSRQMKIKIKNGNLGHCRTENTLKSYASLAGMVKHNTVEVRMQKTKLY